MVALEAAEADREGLQARLQGLEAEHTTVLEKAEQTKVEAQALRQERDQLLAQMEVRWIMNHVCNLC